MVYGDGAFKDPVGKIWELADPVVSPAHTSGLVGYPNEIKLKYVSDNKFANLKGSDLKDAIIDEIRNKAENLTGQMITEGTTPRVLTDLIGSLCDLTSGSGDLSNMSLILRVEFIYYNNSFLKSIVSFKSGPVEIIVTGTLVSDSISLMNALVSADKSP